MIALLLIAVALCAPQHWVHTADGADVWMAHSAGVGPSVVLLHGISANHVFWDLNPEHSLRRALNARGYDVWNLDLRGHGPAERTPSGQRQRTRWDIDTYGKHDLIAAIRFVQAHNDGRPVHLIAHSLGGMVLAVYLAQPHAPPLQSAVVLSTPLDFRVPDRLSSLAFHSTPLTTLGRTLPTPLGARALSHLRRSPFKLDERVFNRQNISAATRRQLYQRGISPISRGELRQLAAFRHDGELHSSDGQTIYREALARSSLPTLVIAGRADHIAPPDRVRAYYEAVGTDDKALVIASRTNGLSADYGHLDIILGESAATDIFPFIYAWLEEHP